MGGATLPPGFRFHPTDEELVGYYLKRKVEGLKIELEVIPVIDLYKFDPWELPDESFLPKRDMEWFFFCPRDRKYPNGSRTNRATKAGYWKATGKDRKVVCQSAVTGYRKTLVFYCGRAPLGDRTDWVMHEYRLWDNLSQGSPNFQGAYALCRVIKRNENGQRTSDPNRESKGKSVGSSSSNGDFTSTLISSEPMSISNSPSQASYLCNESRHSSPIMPCNEVTPAGDFEPAAPLATDMQSSYSVSPDIILDSSKDYPQVIEAISEYFPQYEMPNSMTTWQPFEHTEFSSSSSYSNFAGDIEPTDDLSRIVYMSPYSGQGNYMGFNGNEDLTYEGLEPQGQAAICRQASRDGVFGEFGGLWLQLEDNLTMVI